MDDDKSLKDLVKTFFNILKYGTIIEANTIYFDIKFQTFKLRYRIFTSEIEVDAMTYYYAKYRGILDGLAKNTRYIRSTIGYKDEEVIELWKSTILDLKSLKKEMKEDFISGLMYEKEEN